MQCDLLFLLQGSQYCIRILLEVLEEDLSQSLLIIHHFLHVGLTLQEVDVLHIELLDQLVVHRRLEVLDYRQETVRENQGPRTDHIHAVG